MYAIFAESLKFGRKRKNDGKSASMLGPLSAKKLGPPNVRLARGDGQNGSLICPFSARRCAAPGKASIGFGCQSFTDCENKRCLMYKQSWKILGDLRC